ncbi:hypothetical protein [Sediminibacillus sp. JSM 1682029]|uniref:hypothetical protein n=1 Tax=Sediminibacillus sp. JSM 1682029 TaxID=3229857 RepID=UPI000479F35F
MYAYACPLCNGMRTVQRACEKCGGEMTDQGKLVDFMGDYSPYLDMEIVKTVDGVKDSRSSHTCVHLFQCLDCDMQKTEVIQEVPK